MAPQSRGGPREHRVAKRDASAAVVIAQIFVSAPLFVRAARIGFAEIDSELREAAYVEGSNEWQLFRHILLPLAGRAILSGAVLAWTRALGEFGATILFAGNLEGVPVGQTNYKGVSGANWGSDGSQGQGPGLTG